jgi:hypothetical protein
MAGESTSGDARSNDEKFPAQDHEASLSKSKIGNPLKLVELSPSLFFGQIILQIARFFRPILGGLLHPEA